jgi:hypothetical protein
MNKLEALAERIKAMPTAARLRLAADMADADMLALALFVVQRTEEDMRRALEPAPAEPAPEAPERRILRNRCRCKKCGTVIESWHRHGLVSCACGAIYTDGGREYLHRGGEPTCIEDLTEYAP